MSKVPCKYGLMIDGERSLTEIIAIVKCETGTCGESWTDEHLIYANTDIDQFAHDCAMENASSFGSDGYYVCPECGDHLDEEHCEDCNVSCSYEENSSVCGTVFQYQLSKSGTYVNGGDPIITIMKWIIENGGVGLNNNKALIYASRLKQLVYIPDGKEWEEYNVLIQALREVHSIEVIEIA